MKTAALFVLVVFTCTYAAVTQAEEAAVNFETVEEQLYEEGVDIGLEEIFLSVLSGEAELSPETIVRSVFEKIAERTKAVSRFLRKASFYMCMAACLNRLLPDGKNARGAMMIIHICVMLSVYTDVQAFFQSSRSAIESVSKVIDSLTPMLVSLIAFTGDAHTSSFITPFGAFLSGTIASWFSKGALSLLSVLSCLHLITQIGDMPLGRMTDMIKSVFKWMVASATGLFFLLMSAGGTIAGTYDGALNKGLKYAADSLIPIIGGDIAGKMDSITSSAQLLKSAAGVTGMAALIGACLIPAIDVFLAMWGLKALSALLECVSDKEAMQLADGFAGIFSCLLSLIAAFLCMGIVYIGVAVGLGKRILF